MYQFLCSAVAVCVQRVTTINDDISRLEQWGNVIDELINYITSFDHHHDLSAFCVSCILA